MYYPTGEVNLGALNPSGVQVQQLPDLIRQQMGNQAVLQTQQTDAAQNQNNFAASILATAGNSGNPALYASAKQHLANNGIDTSMYSDDPKIGAQQAQLSRMFGASPTQMMKSMVMEQEMAQRAGTATGNVTGYGWQPGIGNGMNMLGVGGMRNIPQPQGASNNPPALPPVNPNDPVVQNFKAAQQQQQGQLAQTRQLANNNSAPSMPVPQPGDTISKYNADLKSYQLAQENSPTQQGALERARADQKATPDQVKQLNQDAMVASNLLNSMSEIQQAASQAQMGSFAPAKAAMLKAADWLGLPEDMVPEVTSYGDIAKISNDLIGAAAKGAGGASRLQGEFQAIQGSVPGLSADPNALNSLLPMLSRKQYQIVREQNAWNNYSQQNPNGSFNSFSTPWEAQELQSQQQSGGNLPSYPLPNLPAKGSAAYNQQQAMPNSGQIGSFVMQMQKAGKSQDQINAFLKSKGVLNGQ